MKIENTDVEAAYAWPEGMLVQGGATGIVMRSAEQGGSYRTAFVEAFPAGTFIRGQGATVAEAEQACWVKYQRIVACDGGGEHGPYEPRAYTNGSGYCTKCGAWFSGVCEPSIEHKIDALVGQRLRARHGAGWVALVGKTWNALRDHETAVVRHLIGIGNEPGPVPVLTEADQTRLAAANARHRDPTPASPEIRDALRELGDTLLGQMASDLPEGP